MPDGAEDRIAQFADLVAYAIENAETRAELAASRARLVEAADEQRRRVVRDLHDGAQQRLVHAVMTLQDRVAAVGGTLTLDSPTGAGPASRGDPTPSAWRRRHGRRRTLMASRWSIAP